MNAHLSAGIGGQPGSRILNGKPQASLTIKGNRPVSAHMNKKETKSQERQQQQAHHANSNEM
jgi:hypothetical protein